VSVKSMGNLTHKVTIGKRVFVDHLSITTKNEH